MIAAELIIQITNEHCHILGDLTQAAQVLHAVVFNLFFCSAALQGDLSAGANAHVSGEAVTQEGGEGLAQELMSYEDQATEEDNSLLTFEEEVEFDPLKRSDSLSLSKSGSIGKRPPSNRITLEQSTELPASNPQPPPLTSQESLGHIQDLTGIDLTVLSTVPSSAAPQLQQEGLGNMMLHPFHMSTAGNVAAPVNLVVASSAGMVPRPHGGIQIVSATPGGQGQVPLALQGGVAYGGGAPTVVPIMYAAQGNAGMMYQVGNLT